MRKIKCIYFEKFMYERNKINMNFCSICVRNFYDWYFVFFLEIKFIKLFMWFLLVGEGGIIFYYLDVRKKGLEVGFLLDLLEENRIWYINLLYVVVWFFKD